MDLEFVRIQTDTEPLDGLLYRPSHHDGTKPAMQFMHGNTMNFYSGILHAVAQVLVNSGYPCLLYNRRGHDVLSNRNSRLMEGGAFQTMSEAVADNDYARDWLLKRGWGAPVIVGHSNGGMLGVVHSARHVDTPGVALLSAHRGGPDLMKRLARYGLMAGDHYDAITARAQELVAAGRPRELLLCPGWWYVVSAQTYVDYMHSCPSILELAPKLECPVIFFVGTDEPEEIYPAALFCSLTEGPAEHVALKDCDHYYNHREDEVAQRILGWMESDVLTKRAPR